MRIGRVAEGGAEGGHFERVPTIRRAKGSPTSGLRRARREESSWPVAEERGSKVWCVRRRPTVLSEEREAARRLRC